MRARMAHLQTVLQHGDHLLDLPFVQQSGGDAAFRRQALEQVCPFGPFPVGGGLDAALAGFEGDGEAVFGDEGVGALAEAGVDFVEDGVLFADVEGDGHGGEVGFGGCEGGGGGAGEVLRWAVEFVAIGAFLGLVRFLGGGAVLGAVLRY